jgi:hypothetical protein
VNVYKMAEIQRIAEAELDRRVPEPAATRNLERVERFRAIGGVDE